MDGMLIYAVLYAVLIFFDLIPAIKKKDKKSLYFSIPVYLLTLGINVMIALGVNIPRFHEPIKQIINSVFHIQ